MNKFKRALCSLTAVTMLSGMGIIPVAHADYEPIIEVDTVINEWKLDFGTDEDMSGYTHVLGTAHPVMGDLETGVETGYGFVGTFEEDYNFNGRYDGLTMVKGHVTELKETENGIGSVGSKGIGDEATTGVDYPLRFGMYVETGTYYRVRATLTNLEAGDARDVTLYTERKHPVISHATIAEGEERVLEFSVDVEPNYFEKSDPKGLFSDDMLNLALAGENVALSSLVIQQVEPGTTVWVLGDSTVTDGGSTLPHFELDNYTGVGSGLSKYLSKDIAVSNQGEGGLAAGDNYHFNVAKSRIKAGDYMYVEYGHNHKNDGVAGYLGSISKYYDACKNAGATLILVGPIDRHNTYDSSTNTWSTSLAHFPRGAKGYVDCMIYGGESAASTFVSTYKSSGETDAMAYRDTVVAGGEKLVSNIAFVDLNQPSLDWFASISAKGTVAGKEYTNNSKLVDYYFTTSKGGKTDGTHPNDAGAEALAEFFFHDAQAKIAEYPALKGILTAYDGSVPADTETPSGENSSPIAQEVLDGGWAGASNHPSWPDAVSIYSYPTMVRNVNFDEEGKLLSMDVQVLDNSIMPTYARGIVAVYNADGTLAKVAISNAEEASVEAGLAGWVDNSTGVGIQTLAFDGSELTYTSGQTIKPFVIGMEDDEANGYPLNMRPYTDGTYEPVTFDYILTNDTSDGAECFKYYGTKTGTSISSKNGWSLSSSMSAVTTSENNDWYAALSGSGTITKNLTKTMTEGIVEIAAKVRYTSGSAEIRLTDGTNKLVALKIADGTVTTGDGTAVAELVADVWTDVVFNFDLNRGMASVSVGDAKSGEYAVEEFNKVLADEIIPSKLSKLQISTTSADLDITELAVKEMIRFADLPEYTVNAAYATGSDNAMGVVTVGNSGADAVTDEAGFTTSLTAVAKSGYRFVGWYADSAAQTLVSANPSISVKASKNMSVYALFVEHVGYYFDDDFENYDTGRKIEQVGDEVETAPDPVNMGAFILYAGRRANGGVSDKAYVAIKETDQNKYMDCYAGNYASNSRGVKFMFMQPVSIALDETVVFEFDTNLNSKGTVNFLDENGASVIKLTTETIGFNTGAWVNVKMIFDYANTTQYLVVTDTAGKVLNITKSQYTATSIAGANFYDQSAGSVYFDNMKVYDLGTDDTTGEIPVATTITSEAGAEITIAGNTVIADENGRATLELVKGTYDVTAVCSGYEDYSGAAVVDENYAISFEMQERGAEPSTVKLSFVDENGNEIAEPVTISELYTGDAYTMDDTYKKTIKVTDSDGKISAYKYDESNVTTIDALAEGENVLTLKFISQENSFWHYEDFEYVTDPSMITLGDSRLTRAIKNSNKTNLTDYLVVQDPKAIGYNATYALSQTGITGTATFHALVSLGSPNNSSRSVSMQLQGTDGTEIFNIAIKGYDGAVTVSSTEIDVTNIKNGGITSASSTYDTPWLDVTATVDFTKTEDNVSIVVLDTSNNNKEVYNGVVTTTATNIGKIYTSFGRGYGGIGLDDIWVY